MSEVGYSNGRVAALLTIAALLAIGIPASLVYVRTHAREQGRRRLSNESLQVVDEIAQNVRITAFFPQGDDPPTRDLLLSYTEQNQKISFQFIDPDKQPEVAEQYGASTFGEFKDAATGQTERYGTIVLEMTDRKQRIQKMQQRFSEADVTNALARLVAGVTTTVYFTVGHGEKRLDDSGRDGYSIAAGKLKGEDFVIQTLDLAHEPEVPATASLVVMAGPVSEPSAGEVKLLDTYLQNGGSLLVLLDPPPAASMGEFLGKWGIEVGSNFVVDASGAGAMLGSGPSTPLVTAYEGHKITERFNGVMTFYPFVRSISPAVPAVPDTNVEILIRTGLKSWAETDFKTREVTFDESADRKGPVTVAVAATRTTGAKKSCVMAFGDSDFAKNAYGIQQANINLFVDAVSWLARDRYSITIR